MIIHARLHNARMPIALILIELLKPVHHMAWEVIATISFEIVEPLFGSCEAVVLDNKIEWSN